MLASAHLPEASPFVQHHTHTHTHTLSSLCQLPELPTHTTLALIFLGAKSCLLLSSDVQSVREMEGNLEEKE